MKLAESRKLTWIICGVGVFLAVAGVFFLPEVIPIHFAHGMPDDFGNKMEIFLYPVLLLVITFLSGLEKIRYFLTHSKSFLTDTQYNLMIDGILAFIVFVEAYVLYASFA